MKQKYKDQIKRAVEDQIWMIFPSLDHAKNWYEVEEMIENSATVLCDDLDDLIKEQP